jgi:hypothetical protein
MPRPQHEIPTHLNVEDKVLFGLTVRQFLYSLIGCSMSYGLWDQLAATSLAVRGPIVGVCLLATAALVLLHPLGRPVEEWFVAAAFYIATPRRATWRPIEPCTTNWRPHGVGWQELSPDVDWADEARR